MLESDNIDDHLLQAFSNNLLNNTDIPAELNEFDNINLDTDHLPDPLAPEADINPDFGINL